MMRIALICTLFIALAGCQTPTQSIDPTDPNSNQTPGLNYADFQAAANELTAEIIASPLMVHPQAAQGERYVLHISTVTNDTMQRIDTDQLIKGMRVQLLNSGRFFVTTAFDGSDNATREMRELQNDEMVDQTTVQENGTVIAPDFSMSGKILQRNNNLDNDDTRVEYYFQLTLTDLKTGLAYWEGERVIAKVTGQRGATW